MHLVCGDAEDVVLRLAPTRNCFLAAIITLHLALRRVYPKAMALGATSLLRRHLDGLSQECFVIEDDGWSSKGMLKAILKEVLVSHFEVHDDFYSPNRISVSGQLDPRVNGTHAMVGARRPRGGSWMFLNVAARALCGACTVPAGCSCCRTGGSFWRYRWST